MTPLNRCRAYLDDASLPRQVLDDLAKLLAVAEAAQERFDKWTRDTYIALDKALDALTTEER